MRLLTKSYSDLQCFPLNYENTIHQAWLSFVVSDDTCIWIHVNLACVIGRYLRNRKRFLSICRNMQGCLEQMRNFVGI